MQTNTPWSKFHEEMLRQLHAAGHSFGLIADRIGTTRNACIGKAHRLGLLLRGEATFERSNINRKSRPSSPPVVGCETRREVDPPSTNLPAQPPESWLTFAQLDTHHCRWPMGEGRGIRFCGARQLPGHSYCQQHYNMGVHKNYKSKPGGVRMVPLTPILRP